MTLVNFEPLHRRKPPLLFVPPSLAKSRIAEKAIAVLERAFCESYKVLYTYEFNQTGEHYFLI